MSSHRPARVTVAIRMYLLSYLRFLAVGPGARSLGWRLCYRVVAAGVAGALLTAGLTAAPAAPAHAATLPPQITASFDFQSYDVAETSAVINNWWPEMLGLPDNSSLGQLVSGTWNSYQQQNPPSEWLSPQPTDLSGATISVTSDGGTGSVVAFTVPTPPGAGISTTGDADPVVAGLVAQLSGALASVLSLAICGAYLFGLPSNDSGWAPDFGGARGWTRGVCSAITTVVGGVVSGAVNWGLTNSNPPSSKIPWQGLIGGALGGALSGFGIPYVAPIIKAFQYAWLGWATYMAFNAPIDTLISWISPYITSDQQDQMVEFLATFLTNEGLGPDALLSPAELAKLLGFWTPATSGYVGNVPSGEAVAVGSGDCMDAYGSNGGNEPASPPAVPGQSVAINICNGNPSQSFNFWPSGQIENWGLCMDDDGDSNSSDRPVVNLQLCDGGYTQMWYENTTGEIVNAATGNCLDDPASNTTPGIQLIVYPCNGNANQLWAPPDGTAAITGYGNMYSVQSGGSSSSFHYCMMPQTTLANPVGSNVITNNLSSLNSGCGFPRYWARGSNGTLMANGSNALCMDSNGPATTGLGGEAANFVQLQPCDGSQSQVWNVVQTFLGPTLQNAADGLCINTPSGQVVAVVSMVVASCASPPTSGELWTLPGVPFASSSSTGGPCDIYASDGTPCVAAYSMTRAMYASYDGPLYQVTRASDGTPADIGLLSQGGDVDASEQDSFCGGTQCTITKIYDQSPDGNNLTVAPAGGAAPADHAANAAELPVTLNGGSTKAYGLDVEQGVGYRDDSTTGIATGSEPEGMYMVTSGTHANSGCCFDFGNVETSNHDDGAGTMDAVNFSTACPDGPPAAPCSGSGPWVQADLENGLFQEGSNTSNNPNEPTMNSDFVTAMLKNNGTDNFELKGGDAQSGGLSVFWDGGLPPGTDGGGQSWVPMKKQGAVEVGTGGDNSNSDVGSFFEGAITQGVPSDAADSAVQANIVAAGYGGNSAGLTPAANTVTNASGKCLDVNGNDTGTDGTIVDIWDCQSYAEDQHWTHNADETMETLGRCLDIDGDSTTPGALVELWDCDGADGQKWLQEPDGALFNPQSGQCLDDPNGNTANGTQLRIWYCNGAPAQVWTVNGGNPIVGPAGKCLDVLGDDTGGNGTQVDIWDCQANALDQHWTFTPTGQLETLGKCLDIDGDSTTPGALMELWTCDGAGGQVWRQQTDGSLINPQSGLCLDDPGGNTTDGTQLQIWTCNNESPQVFTAYQAGSYLPAGVVTVGGNGSKCLDVNGNDTGTDGTIVDVWDCQPWAVDQHWTRNADGSLETLGRCLDIDGDSTAVGALVELWDCNGAGGQFWVQQPNGMLLNPQSGLCLDDPSGNGTNGTQLEMEICNGSPPEEFDITGGSPIHNTPSGKCIDVIGDDTGGNGSQVDLWDCQSYAADQHWALTPGGQLETLGKCLDIDGDSTTPGALVELWTCDGAGGQVWWQVPGGALVNPQSGLCLDDPNGNTTNGTQLRVWTCNGAGAQQFPVYDTDLYGPAGVVTIGGNVNKCLDVNGNDTGTDGTIVDVWDCQPSAVDQHWTHNANGSLETLGRCLDIDGDSTAQGALVELWDCNGVGGQVWTQYQNGELYNPQSGLCLDDPNGNQADGTQLRIWPCNSSTSAGGTVTPAQEFNLTGGNMVTNIPSGQCMDVIGNDTGGNGSPVDLWGCQSYAIDQHWSLNSSTGTVSTLGLCLDTSGGGTSVGTPVVIANCDGSATQEWTWQSVPAGNQNNKVLMNIGAGLMCLTAPNDTTANGTQLQVSACSTSPSQEFSLG